MSQGLAVMDRGWWVHNTCGCSMPAHLTRHQQLTRLLLRVPPLPTTAGGSDEDSSSASEGEEGSDEEGLTELERRRRRRAAGDHPLQEAFRKASAQLLKKHRGEAGGGCGGRVAGRLARCW